MTHSLFLHLLFLTVHIHSFLVIFTVYYLMLHSIQCKKALDSIILK